MTSTRRVARTLPGRYDRGMESPVEKTVRQYIAAWMQPDPEARAKLLEACFAENGRFVTRGRELHGRAALAEEMARLRADPDLLRIRVTSVIDAGATTFRFRAVVDRRDGSSPENLETGEVDASGKISLLLTFTGPLADA